MEMKEWKDVNKTLGGRTVAGLVLVAIVGVLAGCSSGAAATSGPSAAIPSQSGPTSPGQSSAGSRPSSPAVVRILAPKANQVVTGSTVHVVLQLDNAEIVPATTTNITPDTGHVHLYVDGVLVSMNYGLEQDIPVHPGTYSLKAEFVAADHVPFNPRVYSPDVVFTVK